MATYSSILAWKIPWAEEPGGLQSMGSQRAGHDLAATAAAAHSLPWDSPDKNTGVGCHSLLQGIFLTQGFNPRLLHWQVNSLPLSHQGSIIYRTIEQAKDHGLDCSESF